ncbi:PREDICTED: fatty acyl-CoA reductase 1-like [Dinoponera quadriceps]|uniref:Fatty acyl-CoA reductase n=1 Tax=Dinoponera quadriceps TaxID=609295 RepID=A0A6P3X1M3_DINQU|nr:PREDICTED: fatty acyl-CoA reductase 1-like [Dinoponera quadriceps]XP_014472235.1 PREDICTED: fatty acyl-CoA reductase 1-like [Dinoponera quadriceps]XP_014472242.1 PREDICTED: fatty acyl-CoA reductase 1-like [Dinoponera quadriceps]
MGKMDSALSIPAFYSGKSIFITGATGFLGKCLIEKLLRSCPDIGEIFLLIRPKKGDHINERLRQMLTNPLFDTLRRKQPTCFDKLIPIEGDIGFKGLGLSAADRDTLIEKISVIFHIAAYVKFENTLKNAILKNVRSTRDICILGEQIKNLSVLVHISTAYTKLDEVVIDETVHPVEADWRKTIQIAEALDDDISEVFKSKYLGKLPNHYVFSKRLAEQIIVDYSRSLPCVICRPSLVVSSLNEPIKGWIDNFNGPISIHIGIGKGVLRILYADRMTRNNYVPIDIVTKMMIVAAWKHGTKMTETQDDFPFIYNCAATYSTTLTFEESRQMGLSLGKKNPFDNIMWRPSVTFTKSYFFYYLLTLLVHIMPALVIDGLLRLSGRKPRLLKVQRKIFVANQIVAYFMLNEWNIRNEKIKSLSDEILPDDQREFGYLRNLNDKNFNIYNDTYYENAIIGSKIYLLNESMDQLDAAKSHFNRMVWIDRIVKTLAGFYLIWIIYGILCNYVNCLSSMITSYDI